MLFRVFFSILEEFLFVALSTPVCIRITTNTGDVNDSRNRTSDWHHPGIAVLFWRIDLHQFTTNYRWRLLESIVTSTRKAITFFYRQIDSKWRRYPLADEGRSHLSPAHTSNLPASHLFKHRRKKSRHFGWALCKYHFVLVLFNLLPRSNSVSQQYGSLLKTNVWTSIIHLVEVDPRELTIYLRIRYSADVLFRLFFCSLCAWVRDHPTFVSSFSFTYLHRWDIFVFSRIILIASAS